MSTSFVLLHILVAREAKRAMDVLCKPGVPIDLQVKELLKNGTSQQCSPFDLRSFSP